MSWAHLRQLDERAIRYFVVVCEEQSVRAASERLRIAPSAIGRKLKELETDLGVSLLTRTSKGISLTALGNMLLAYLRERHARDGEILSKMLDISRLQDGEIRIALGEAFLADFVQSAMRIFFEEHKNIKLKVYICNTDEIVNSLNERQTDIGIAFYPPDAPGSFVAHERQSSIVCFFPSTWHFVPSEDVTLNDLTAYPCALLSRAFSARNLIDAAERTAGARLNVVMETNSLAALKQIVIGGTAFTLLPELAMRPEVTAGTVRQVKVAAPALNAIRIRLLVSDLAREFPLTVELLRIMREHMPMLRDDPRLDQPKLTIGKSFPGS